MKSSKYISILCVGSLLSLASCTDGFESDNKSTVVLMIL